MHRIGSELLATLLNVDTGEDQGRVLSCDCGHKAKFVDYRDKHLVTVLGSVTITRAYYYDRRCKAGSGPKDTVLDIVGTSYSPGVRRMMGRVGALRAFALGQEDLQELAGITVETKEIERYAEGLGKDVEGFFKVETARAAFSNVIPLKTVPILSVCMDGTGVPVVKAETVNRRGKGEEGQAKTREAKLGCVFTQATVNDNGYPVREAASTSYVGAIETAEVFSARIYAEAVSSEARRRSVCGETEPRGYGI